MDHQRWPQPLRSPDMPGSPNEQEKKSPIPYSAVQQIHGGTAILDKIYSVQGWRRTVDKRLSKVPPGKISPEIRTALYLETGKLTGGREPGHLLRLLQREGAEYDFAVAFIRYAPELFRNDKELREHTNAILNGEYTDTMMWWTLAPYLYRNMVNKGVEERDAIQKILNWAGESPIGRGDSREFEIRDKHNLSGLEVFNKEGVSRYALTQDPEHISHKFTEQEAERIVREVFGIKEAAK